MASWDRVSRLLLDVLDLPPGERHDVLQRECCGDFRLLHEIQSLTWVDDSSVRFLDRSPADWPTRASSAGPVEGEVLHAYRLVRQLASGMMTSVYAGERCEEIRSAEGLQLYVSDPPQAAAVKVLTAREGFGRFVNELLMLLSLHDLDVPRVYCSGRNEAAVTYFAMELVQGQCLHEAVRDLSICRRLRLVEALCETVDAFHDRSVLHLDIKPANVLAGGNGEVRVIDFGIARQVKAARKASGALSFYRFPDLAQLLTPGYASPEQTLGQEVSLASDLYSLGVVLYEVLTGRRPFRGVLRKVGHRRLLLHEAEPQPIGDVIHRAFMARHRGGQTGQQLPKEMLGLPKACAVKLDGVFRRALATDPKKRHLSAVSLAHDAMEAFQGFAL